jgi:hypothetical protein
MLIAFSNLLHWYNISTTHRKHPITTSLGPHTLWKPMTWDDVKQCYPVSACGHWRMGFVPTGHHLYGCWHNVPCHYLMWEWAHVDVLIAVHRPVKTRAIIKSLAQHLWTISAVIHIRLFCSSSRDLSRADHGWLVNHWKWYQWMKPHRHFADELHNSRIFRWPWSDDSQGIIIISWWSHMWGVNAQ